MGIFQGGGQKMDDFPETKAVLSPIANSALHRTSEEKADTISS
jgi:hypothetical protein